MSDRIRRDASRSIGSPPRDVDAFQRRDESSDDSRRPLISHEGVLYSAAAVLFAVIALGAAIAIAFIDGLFS